MFCLDFVLKAKRTVNFLNSKVQYLLCFSNKWVGFGFLVGYILKVTFESLPKIHNSASGNVSLIIIVGLPPKP